VEDASKFFEAEEPDISDYDEDGDR
jgi:hypothetical protein